MCSLHSDACVQIILRQVSVSTLHKLNVYYVDLKQQLQFQYTAISIAHIFYVNTEGFFTQFLKHWIRLRPKEMSKKFTCCVSKSETMKVDQPG